MYVTIHYFIWNMEGHVYNEYKQYKYMYMHIHDTVHAHARVHVHVPSLTHILDCEHHYGSNDWHSNAGKHSQGRRSDELVGILESLLEGGDREEGHVLLLLSIANQVHIHQFLDLRSKQSKAVSMYSIHVYSKAVSTYASTLTMYTCEISIHVHVHTYMYMCITFTCTYTSTPSLSFLAL